MTASIQLQGFNFSYNVFFVSRAMFQMTSWLKWRLHGHDAKWKYENALSKHPNKPQITDGLCYQYSLLIEQNERSAEAAAPDQTVWHISHAKPASPQQTNSLFMGFSGA